MSKKYVNLAKYAKLVKNHTEYAQRMKHLSNRIFGEATRPATKKSMQIIQLYREEPYHLKQQVINYYPRHVEFHKLVQHLRGYGLYRSELADWKEETNRLRVLRGAGPPDRKTKEEGKRWKDKQKKLEEEAKQRAIEEGSGV